MSPLTRCCNEQCCTGPRTHLPGAPSAENIKIVIGYSIPWQPAFREGITRGCNLSGEYWVCSLLDDEKWPFKNSSCVRGFSVGHMSLFSVWGCLHVNLSYQYRSYHYNSDFIKSQTRISKLPAAPLFAQPFVQVQIKENIKVLCPWAKCSHWWLMDSPHKEQEGRKWFHLITSSCNKSFQVCNEMLMAM